MQTRSHSNHPVPETADAAPRSAETSFEELDAFQSMKRMFEQIMVQKLAQLEPALDAGDWEEVAQLAHSLKGSAGSFGYPRVTDIARELEHAARRGEAERARDNGRRLTALDEVQKLYRQNDNRETS